MNKLIYLFAFLGLLAFSCSDDTDPVKACNVDNVLDMPWMQELIAETEEFEIGRDYAYITMGTYDSQTVFVPQNCCPNCNMSPPLVYDCSGEVLGQLRTDGIEWEEITDSEVIWKSSNNSCNI